MMFVLKWSGAVLGKPQYAMPDPVEVTDLLCKAQVFLNEDEALKFKEDYKLKYFTVVQVEEQILLDSMKSVLSDLRDEAMSNFKSAAQKTKELGIKADTLHSIVDGVYGIKKR